MAEEKIYPKGILAFKKNDNAPDFVLGTIVINLSQFNDWINGDGKQYLTDYKGAAQLKLQALNGKKGLYLTVDTFKPRTATTEQATDLAPESPTGDLPF